MKIQYLFATTSLVISLALPMMAHAEDNIPVGNGSMAKHGMSSTINDGAEPTNSQSQNNIGRKDRFSGLDVNKDGVISEGEFVNGKRGNGATFKRYDANKDGHLDRAEFGNYWKARKMHHKKMMKTEMKTETKTETMDK